MKALLTTFGVLIIALYCSPLLKSKLNIGNIFGIVLGVSIIILNLLFYKYKPLFDSKLFIISLSIYLLFIVLHFITLIYVIIGSKNTSKEEKTLIVLGCRVKGTTPSKALTERCNQAFKYLEKNDDAIAILSGGQGHDEKISEAECMHKILLDKGISNNRLFIEDKSTSTYENLLFSQQIIEKYNLSMDAAVVSSEYHLCRTKIIAKTLNMNISTIPAKSAKLLRVPYFSREVFGIWWQILKRR